MIFKKRKRLAISLKGKWRASRYFLFLIVWILRWRLLSKVIQEHRGGEGMTTKAWDWDWGGRGSPSVVPPPTGNWRCQDHPGRKGEHDFTPSAFCAGWGHRADSGHLPGSCVRTLFMQGLSQMN